MVEGRWTPLAARQAAFGVAHLTPQEGEDLLPLGKLARERLRRLGKHNVHARIGDGYFGWEEHAPFDGIMVTAAGDHIPPPLVRQLKPGGKLVMPVGGFLTQYLVLVEKAGDGSVTTRQLLPVRFVPLTGDHKL